MKRPLLTLVIPYTDYKLFERARDSALSALTKKQLAQVQLLAIADGPTEGADIEHLMLPYNTLTNCGISTPGGIPRAIGTIMAKGEWVAYLDQDNTFESGYLPQLLKVLENAPANVLYYWTARTLYIEGQAVCVDDFESVDQVMLDTNCMVVRAQLLRPHAGAWAIAHNYGDDRFVWHVMQDIKKALRLTSRFTGIVGAPINYNVNRKNWTVLRAYLRSTGRLK